MPDQPWVANAEWVSRRLSDQVSRGPLQSTLIVDTLPGLIGGEFRGHIEVAGDPQQIRQARTLRVTLSCQLWDREPRPVFGGRVRGAVLWSKTVDLTPASNLAFAFAIPSDVYSSNELHLNGQILWLVDFDVLAPGLKQWSQFEVPIFRTGPIEGKLPPLLTVALPSSAIEPLSGPIVAPLSPQIRRQETAAGLRLDFPPFQARKGAFMFLLLTAAFGAAAYVCRQSFLASLVMATLTLLLAYLTLDLFLASSTAVIGKDSAFVERRMIIPVSRKNVPRSSITDVRVHLVYGSGYEKNRQTFYRIDLLTRERKMPTIVGKYIENQAEAEWLVKQIRERLNLSS